MQQDGRRRVPEGIQANCGDQIPPYLKFWAKTGDQNMYHPLLLHMLDVAAVAGRIWDDCLTSCIRNRLENGLRASDARSAFVCLAGAHDIGKANPAFQKRQPALHGLEASWFSENDHNRPHGHVSASVLREVLPSPLYGQIAGGHHGVFPRSIELQMGRDTLGNNEWKEARAALLMEFSRVTVARQDWLPDAGSEISDPGLVPLLAGLITVADWIGSNQELFPCAREAGDERPVDASAYWDQARQQAQKALEQLGWLPSVAFAKEAPFGSVFPSLKANALQEAAISLSSEQHSPYLMIVEAPMGLGKTEAALYAADLAFCRGFARGMYVAMPTQATGNAMFKRVLDDYLKIRGHSGKLNVQLVHGNALLSNTAEPGEGEVTDYRPRSVGEESGDVEAQSWFTARKRPLLAPFGVGTIDQSLLSVLQTRHWFVRMLGLAGKVVIFDEVHAYDAYMGTILERLLHWLAELDCTVILLSATLPEARRRALARAYSGRDDSGYCRYPRLTLARPRRHPAAQTGERPSCIEVPEGVSYRVHLQYRKSDLAALTGILTAKLACGGCAAVVCNTVDRSIEVYRHVRDNLQDTECLLFHARTLQMWRREREQEVLCKFGKGEKQPNGTYLNPARPKRAVLVATQVIEQSLDLDFDLMVSEMAPIDLLLQRAGRLHRHPRQRPPGLEQPLLIVLCDAETAGPPPESFGRGIEYVYNRYILLRTWLTLRERGGISVPTEIEKLVEGVYGLDGPSPENGWTDALTSARAEMEFERSESEKAACRLLVAQPSDPSDLVEQFNEQLTEDEDHEVHKAVRASTREGDPSLTVILLPAGETPPDVTGQREIRRLLDNSVSFSHRGVLHALLEHNRLPNSWRNSAHLRHCRLLQLDTRGRCRAGEYVLWADEQVGIIISKEAESDGRVQPD